MFLDVVEEFGSWERFLKDFLREDEIFSKPCVEKVDMPAVTNGSTRLSKELKSRGMKFVGPTIVYAYMQVCSDFLLSSSLVYRERGRVSSYCI